MACGQQKVKGGHGSITASSSASCSASIITLNLGVGCAPSCWPIFGFRNLLGARRGRRGQFSVQSDKDRKSVVEGKGVDLGGRRIIKKKSETGAKKNVCELRRGFLCRSFSIRSSQSCGGVGCMDVCPSVGAFRIARRARGVGLDPSCWPIFGFRNLLGARRGLRGQFSVQSDNRFSGRGGGVGSLPRAWRRVGVPKAQQVLKKNGRSEERRVGKECRSRWSPYHYNK